MTTEDVNKLIDEILEDVDNATTINETPGVDPKLVPMIIIGRAAEDMLPGLAEAVTKWIEGNMPTEEERNELVQQMLSDGEHHPEN
jgi:hypothetical protein